MFATSFSCATRSHAFDRFWNTVIETFSYFSVNFNYRVVRSSILPKPHLILSEIVTLFKIFSHLNFLLIFLQFLRRLRLAKYAYSYLYRPSSLPCALVIGEDA